MAGKKDFVINGSQESKELTRNNHYVPQWYQKGFIENGNKLHYLNLAPDEIVLENGRVIKHNERRLLAPGQCFFEYDLYTTFFGPFISDLIERNLFGEIDGTGAKALKAFIDGNDLDRHDYFLDFFKYIDAQKTRTPKGLTWLKARYQGLDQQNLMTEMQSIQQMHCTMWLEGTREIVSAKESATKFIISDHPVTIYNYACPPGSKECTYPEDPSIALKGSQTIFALDRNHCLILTNYELASEPEIKDPKNRRTNARNFGNTMVNTTVFLRDRCLTETQVREINFVIKQRARRYIAGGEKEWLYPESDTTIRWENIKNTLLPPSNKVYKFGGEMFAGTRSGKVHYQDAFGRTSKNSDFLLKQIPKGKVPANAYCPCGQGKKYKNCCRDIDVSKRPAWDVYSIRERNIIFFKEIDKILGFDKGKEWDDIRRELNNDQVRALHSIFASLWPEDTNIISLLPKSDGKIRAVYSGRIDVRTIPQYALSSTLYFDELIVHHPFINPRGFKAEFSPLEHPSKFRQHTLKALALLLTIQPLVVAGKINLVPDPGLFNEHLRFQAIDSAKLRRSGSEVNKEEMESFSDLWHEDHERMIYCLPPEQKRAQIKKANPEASEELIKGAILLMEKKRNDDPLALLQDDLYLNGGQVDLNSMAPNFEMALFLAQITGAILLTDSPTRLEEFANAQNPDGILTGSVWKVLTQNIRKIEFPFNYEPAAVLELWREGKFGKMRKAWQTVYDFIFKSGEVEIVKATALLNKELLQATEAARKEMDSLMNSNPEINSAKYGFTANFQLLVPNGGIGDKRVLRLLLTSGLEEYAKNVPIAVFMKIKA
ncbi:DUF4238 domain-containing protein [Pedobacter metabolipauper]|uniref:Uncharacterized protein DUF4238 n=1 Tax=Pedobacter metabolipauper TaxID=425513 RepID=A0A4R6SYP3_9SPHI|nr:DUF4238 domain-containing protein [Pedobacter metabolipauper]TDQ11714.1 uncharacterized protein DUF4238 [Pedobacter metabolipauper]